MMNIPMKRLFLATILLVAISALPARAQMVTGPGMTDFNQAFDISAKGWSVKQTACSLGANVLWPGDEATFTFFLKPGQPLKGRGARGRGAIRHTRGAG